MAFAEVVLHKKGEPLKNGNYPVKLMVYQSRTKRNYYSLNNFEPADYNPEEWVKLKKGVKLNPKQRQILLRIADVEKLANDIIKDLGGNFNLERFKAKFFNNHNENNLKEAFEDYIKGLELEGRPGTAESYTSAMNSFIEFKGEGLLLTDIDKDFLKAYETWMVGREKSLTTVGIYARSLRSIINLAIENGIVHKENYPFGKRRYQIPTGRNVKKALEKTEVKTIFTASPEPGTKELKALDFWIFSYLGNGANMADICRFKYKNIEGENIVFVRAKTVRTKKDSKPIVIVLNDRLKQIIKRWGNDSIEPENYIFNVLKPGMTPKQELAAIKQLTKTTNKYMDELRSSLGIGKKVRTYEARHSFSTMLKNSGVSVEFISEALGHSSILTTQNYLGSFEDEQRKQAVSNLTDFD